MPDDKPISVNIDEACRLVGVRRSTIYKLVKAGDLRLVKIGRRSVIPFSDLEKLIADEGRGMTKATYRDFAADTKAAQVR